MMLLSTRIQVPHTTPMPRTPRECYMLYSLQFSPQAKPDFEPGSSCSQTPMGGRCEPTERVPVHIWEAVGHADLPTTMAYTYLASEHLRGLVDEPRSRGGEEPRLVNSEGGQDWYARPARNLAKPSQNSYETLDTCLGARRLGGRASVCPSRSFIRWSVGAALCGTLPR